MSKEATGARTNPVGAKLKLTQRGVCFAIYRFNVLILRWNGMTNSNKTILTSDQTKDLVKQ